jgi:1,5-anhydro-D-fructose reductase (1,5-anhydro-D-mannitol-forming)
MTKGDQRTVRYGIVGFGRFAENAIAPAIRNAKNSALVALQKRSIEAARKKADEHAVPMAFGTVEELVRHPDVDAVFIVSANAAHRAETVAAADAGKHVIVEKPMANSVREAEEMIAACRRNNVKLMVGHMVRLSPLVRRILEIITSGAIGRVTSARAEFMYDGRNSHRTWLIDRAVAGGGPVFDIGVHCIDTLRAILADEPVLVSAALSPLPSLTATEEVAHVSLRFSGGVVASVFCSYIAPFRRTFIEFLGTEGVVAASDFTVVNQKGRLTVTKGKGDRPGATTIEDIAVPNLYVEEVSLFTSWVLGGSAPEIDGENGLKNQRVIDRALEGIPVR